MTASLNRRTDLFCSTSLRVHRVARQKENIFYIDE